TSFAMTMLEYQYLNRSVVAQELNLTPAERTRLRQLVETNMRRENQYYRYDYFRDNCSTRVRDLLDKLTDGAMKRTAGARMSGHSYRWQTLRLMRPDKPLVTGVDIAMGRPGDGEMSVWQEMFLPEKLQDF